MKRRHFVFTSAKTAALLSPVLSLRHVTAQSATAKRLFVWVCATGYPDENAFFPSGSGTSFELSEMLVGFEALKEDMVVVRGVDIRDSGPNPKGNDHVRTMGKVLTAKDVIPHPSDNQNGLPGGISIDQLIARERSWRSLETYVDEKDRDHMRSKPFATGPKAFKKPIFETTTAWDRVFENVPPSTASDKELQQANTRLLLRKSLLDDLTGELSRFRAELSGIEKEKLEIHEDAIRRAEQSVAQDLERSGGASAACVIPERHSIDVGTDIPTRGKAHLDIMFAALACDLVQVGSMMWGYSGYHWPYRWVLGDAAPGSIHDDVHHRAGAEREKYVQTARWDWTQLAGFLQRMKATPEGAGNMLDNSIVLAISNFGRHHSRNSLALALFGKAGGALRTGRYVNLSNSQHNDTLLTSVAHLAGVPISGIGDDLKCGRLVEL